MSYIIAENNKADPSKYLLSLEQMIENDYPIPSYMADVFEKPPGWLETPNPAESEGQGDRKVYAMDCEMVCSCWYHTQYLANIEL